MWIVWSRPASLDTDKFKMRAGTKLAAERRPAPTASFHISTVSASVQTDFEPLTDVIVGVFKVRRRAGRLPLRISIWEDIRDVPSGLFLLWQGRLREKPVIVCKNVQQILKLAARKGENKQRVLDRRLTGIRQILLRREFYPNNMTTAGSSNGFSSPVRVWGWLFRTDPPSTEPAERVGRQLSPCRRSPAMTSAAKTPPQSLCPAGFFSLLPRRCDSVTRESSESWCTPPPHAHAHTRAEISGMLCLFSLTGNRKALCGCSRLPFPLFVCTPRTTVDAAVAWKRRTGMICCGIIIFCGGKTKPLFLLLPLSCLPSAGRFLPVSRVLLKVSSC